MKSENRFVYTLMIVFVIACCILAYKCTCTDSLDHFGDDSYLFVGVQTNAGRRGITYYGSISVDDYQKWVEGQQGTVFVYNVAMDGYGHRINLSSIVSMNNFGNQPDWLPLNFWMQ